MKRLAGALFLIALTAILPSCGVSGEKDKKDEKKKDAPRTKLVGRVASLAADKKFVLVQSYGNWEVPVGGVLTTRGPQERVANLRSTGENLGQFAAADIQAGDPQVGDAVFSVIAEPEKPEPAAEPDKKAAASPTAASGSLPEAPKMTQGE